MSVLENLELVAGIYGQNSKAAKKNALEIAQRFGLEDELGKKAKKLSGGMQRRLSIAMALISEPKILFLDEPTLGLDVLARRELWASIKSLKGRVTIILTTHYMDEVENLSDRIGIIALTSLIFVGTGLFFGSILNNKAVGGVCGALLTNVAGWLSGVFIPVDLIGGPLKIITNILPFYHSVKTIREALSGNSHNILPHLAIVTGYTVVIFALAIIVFNRKMSGKKS